MMELNDYIVIFLIGFLIFILIYNSMSSIKKTQHKSNNKSYKSSNEIEGLKDLNTNLDKISNQSKPVSKISEKSISITISKAAASPFPSSYFLQMIKYLKIVQTVF